jgi:isoquinoline 1-oxidoreductase beta subunit
MLLADKAGWSLPKNKNEGKGLAIVFSCGTICAQVVRVELKNNKIVIKKVVAVVDCGMYVNSNTIRAQIEGSIIMAIGAATMHAIHFENGRAKEANFSTYKMPRMIDTPDIEVHIVENEEKPGGIGEPGLPPLAPALANAIFDLTGQRYRTLPLSMKLV